MRAESFYNFATYIEEVSDLRAYGGKSLHERQLSFLKIIHDLASPGHAQFLIATHSPIILSYPGAVLFSLDGDAIRMINYRETKHFLITRDFLNSPEKILQVSLRNGGRYEKRCLTSVSSRRRPVRS